jgi:polysaccharide biosynthesis protein PslE
MSYDPYAKPLTVFDIIASIYRYKWRFLLVTTFMLGLCIASILLFPKKYESEATLFVRLGRGSATMDPATVGQTISIQESRESELNSIVDMLQSRGLAESVVDDIGAQRLNRRYTWLERQLEWKIDSLRELLGESWQGVAPGAESLTPEELGSRKDWEEAVLDLQDDLRINAAKKSTTITITFRGRTPELARDVVQSVIDNYQRMHVDAYRSTGSLDFFETQFADRSAELEAAERQLRETKNEHRIISLTGEQQSLQSEITEIEKSRMQTLADLRAAEAKLQKLESQLATLPDEIFSSKTQGVAVGSTNAMRDRLYGLELEEEDLLARYSESHPKVTAIREQLRNARRIMAEQPSEREENTLAINPVRLETQNEALTAEGNVASLSAKLESLDEQKQELLARLRSINDLQLVSESLQRKIDIGRDHYHQYAMKLEESRIKQALDQIHLSNVSVVADPTLQYKHVSPNRMMLAILGLMVSITCGMAVVLLSEYGRKQRSRRVASELNSPNAWLREDAASVAAAELHGPATVARHPSQVACENGDLDHAGEASAWDMQKKEASVSASETS